MDFPNDAGLVGEVGRRLLSGLGLEAALEPGRLVRPDRAEIIRHRPVAGRPFTNRLLETFAEVCSERLVTGLRRNMLNNFH